jgi:hypothetical protein
LFYILIFMLYCAIVYFMAEPLKQTPSPEQFNAIETPLSTEVISTSLVVHAELDKSIRQLRDVVVSGALTEQVTPARFAKEVDRQRTRILTEAISLPELDPTAADNDEARQEALAGQRAVVLMSMLDTQSIERAMDVAHSILTQSAQPETSTIDIKDTNPAFNTYLDNVVAIQPVTRSVEGSVDRGHAATLSSSVLESYSFSDDEQVSAVTKELIGYFVANTTPRELETLVGDLMEQRENGAFIDKAEMKSIEKQVRRTYRDQLKAEKEEAASQAKQTKASAAEAAFQKELGQEEKHLDQVIEAANSMRGQVVDTVRFMTGLAADQIGDSLDVELTQDNFLRGKWAAKLLAEQQQAGRRVYSPSDKVGAGGVSQEVADAKQAAVDTKIGESIWRHRSRVLGFRPRLNAAALNRKAEPDTDPKGVLNRIKTAVKRRLDFSVEHELRELSAQYAHIGEPTELELYELGSKIRQIYEARRAEVVDKPEKLARVKQLGHTVLDLYSI